MRLVNLKTHKLEEFPLSPFPKYAILSHRWSEPQDEISFADMDGGTGEGKPGYQRIPIRLD